MVNGLMEVCDTCGYPTCICTPEELVAAQNIAAAKSVAGGNVPTVTITDAEGKRTTMDIATLQAAMAKVREANNTKEQAQAVMHQIERIEGALRLQGSESMTWAARAERVVTLLQQAKQFTDSLEAHQSNQQLEETEA